MATLWFCLVALMLTTYVVLDGFDLGAGLVHLWVARTPAERAAVIRSVGPVWDGNEVWLLATGGALFCAFPTLFATAFSGFYLPLMIVLWLLVGRALGIEFRHQLEHSAWTGLWDVIFSLSSALLALFFGVALGNVVRGVPLGSDGTFFEPLWASFEPGSGSGILDGYTVLAGLTATAALAHHGSLWIALKTDGEVRDRARRAAGVSAAATAVLTVAATLWTRSVQPHMSVRFGEHPAGFGLPLLASVGLAASVVLRRRGRDLAAFAGSTVFLVGMMVSIVFSVYPYVLPASTDVHLGLTVDNASAPESGLRTALGWWIPGMVPVVAYFVFIYRKFSGRLEASDGGYGGH